MSQGSSGEVRLPFVKGLGEGRSRDGAWGGLAGVVSDTAMALGHSESWGQLHTCLHPFPAPTCCFPFSAAVLGNSSWVCNAVHPLIVLGICNSAPAALFP